MCHNIMKSNMLLTSVGKGGIMTPAERVREEIKNLLETLVYKSFGQKVSAALRILEEIYDTRFYRVSDWPDVAARPDCTCNFIIVNSHDDIKVSLGDPENIVAMLP